MRGLIRATVLLALVGCRQVAIDSHDRSSPIVVTPDTSFSLDFEVRTSLAWLDTSTIAVIDAESKQVVILGRDGSVRLVGREGRGPGEFLLPFASHLGPRGELLVLDWKLRRIERFGPDLSPLGFWNMHRFINGIVGVVGDSIGMMWQVFPPDSLGRAAGLLLPGDDSARTLWRFGSVDSVFSEIRELEPGQKVPDPKLLLRSDGLFVLNEAASYRIWLVDRAGRVLATGGRPGLPEAPEEGDPGEMEAAIERARRITQDPEMQRMAEASIRRRYSSPRYRHRWTATSPDRRLWVIADRGGRDSTSIDFFDADLRYEGTIRLPGEVWGIAPLGDRFATLVGHPGEAEWRLDIHRYSTAQIR